MCVVYVFEKLGIVSRHRKLIFGRKVSFLSTNFFLCLTMQTFNMAAMRKIKVTCIDVL